MCEIKTIIRVTGKFAFKMYDTYGYPIDLLKLRLEELTGYKVIINEIGFKREMELQKQRSRNARK